MSNVMDYAKWFIDQNLDTPQNTLKGNIKLQKLLFFAQLISLVKNNKRLFDDNFYAFTNGMVIEDVRLMYCNNYRELCKYEPNSISEEDIEILNITKDIYGNLDSNELSSMSHEFAYWEKYLKKATKSTGFKVTELSKIPNKELEADLDNIKNVLRAYDLSKNFDSNEIDEEDLDY